MDEREYYNHTRGLEDTNLKRIYNPSKRRRLNQFRVYNAESIEDFDDTSCKDLIWDEQMIINNAAFDQKKRKIVKKKPLLYFIQPQPLVRDVFNLPYSKRFLFDMYSSRFKDSTLYNQMCLDDRRVFLNRTTPKARVNFNDMATREQTRLKDRVIKFFLQKYDSFTSLVLTGSAGTGKSFTLGVLAESKIYNVCYTTIKGDLVRSMLEQYPNICGLVSCQIYLNLLGMNFYRNYRKFIYIIAHQTFENIETIVDRMTRDDFNIEKFKEYAQLSTDNWCLYLDEFSMYNASEIFFLHQLLKRASILFDVKIYFILSGDPHQIPPIISVFEDNADRILQIVDNSIHYTQQLRNKDTDYISFIESIKTQKDYVAYVSNYFSNLNQDFTIRVAYPIEAYNNYPMDVRLVEFDTVEKLILDSCFDVPKDEILDNDPSDDFPKPYKPQIIDWLPYKIENVDKLLDWWAMFKKEFNNFTVLTKTNQESHRLNMLLFMQLVKSIDSLDDTNRRDQIFGYSYILFKKKLHEYKLIYNKPEYLPICPLIVGAAYILEQTINQFRRGEMLYLLYFDRDFKLVVMINDAGQLLVLRGQEYRNQTFTKDSRHFYSISHLAVDDPYIFGFPLQLAYARNIFKCQGLTFDTHISLMLDLQNCSREEVFVALSRCKIKNQIKRLII